MRKTTVKKVIIVPATAATIFAFGVIAPMSISAADGSTQLTTAIEALQNARNNHLKQLLQNSEVLNYLNMSAEDLINLKQQDKTIKDYALENGYSLEGLKQVMTDEFIAKVNQKYEEGKISADRRDYLLVHKEDKINYWLENEKSMFRWFGR